MKIMSLSSVFVTGLVLSFGLSNCSNGGEAPSIAAGDTFWVPTLPPRAGYKIECKADLEQGRLHCKQEIRFKNDANRPMSRLAMNWSWREFGALEIEANGKKIFPIPANQQPTDISLIPFVLPEPLNPGEEITLQCQFEVTRPGGEVPSQMAITGWYPRLWWGFETYDGYEVKVDLPSDSEYMLEASGRFEEDTGYYQIDGARSFGLFLAQGMKQAEAKAGEVLVRSLYTPKAEACAKLLLTTAVDVINFYRKRFGFYPFQSLTIVPGGDRPAGGYPVATGIVAIHGQEQMSERAKSHWQWITAHEIGHQYWGEYVMEKDSPGWLWIGLGIYADREYFRAKGFPPDHHRALMNRYLNGVSLDLDTTVARPPEQVAGIGFDHNNIVIHGKGYSIISALSCVLGEKVFDRIYRKCLEQFAGRRMGADEFQAVCETGSGQNLDWFFDQWVRSNRSLSYKIVSSESIEQNGRYSTEVRIERLGDLEMPVPVQARFKDGTSQLGFTDRLLKTNILRFDSETPVEDVQLDPEHNLAMMSRDLSASLKDAKSQDVAQLVLDLSWTNVGPQALEVFQAAKSSDMAGDLQWLKLGLVLYDAKYYHEALEAFRRSEELATDGSIYKFPAIVWQGHLLDLSERRKEALVCYRKALENDMGDFMDHDQYQMRINRAWVEKRLKEPFRR